MPAMPARKLNPIEKEAKKPNPFPSPEEEKAFSSAMNEYLEELKKPVLNSWDKAIIIPFSILFVGFALAEQFTDIKIFEEPDNQTILSALFAVLLFGFLMSLINNARQGRVFGRRGWIRKAKRPKAFFVTLTFYVGLTLVVCAHALHTVLTAIF